MARAPLVVGRRPSRPARAFRGRTHRGMQGAATILVYNVTFEKARVDGLKKGCRLQAKLEAIKNRIVDLLPIVRDHVYHPDFDGSFSLKKCCPRSCPEWVMRISTSRTASPHQTALEALHTRHHDGTVGARDPAKTATRILRARHAGDGAAVRASEIAFVILGLWKTRELLRKLPLLAVASCGRLLPISCANDARGTGRIVTVAFRSADPPRGCRISRRSSQASTLVHG